MNSIKTSNFSLNKEWLNESNFHVGLFLDIKWKEIHFMEIHGACATLKQVFRTPNNSPE